MSTSPDAAARAIAFFESTDDLPLLHRCAEEIAPRAKRMVARYLRQGSEDSIPYPTKLPRAAQPATAGEAQQTLAATTDFALLQAIARAIGRRIEALEIVASAEFPVGARVRVPASGSVAAPGVVERSGTSLRVRLEGGGDWEGPPSLAERIS